MILKMIPITNHNNPGETEKLFVKRTQNDIRGVVGTLLYFYPGNRRSTLTEVHDDIRQAGSCGFKYLVPRIDSSAETQVYTRYILWYSLAVVGVILHSLL